ncbi:MAG: hypothetical protein IPK99_03110 [Flavobacteriales bacterium]|nr:hypothetical protein [Flavobacteriales bacterium]
MKFRRSRDHSTPGAGRTDRRVGTELRALAHALVFLTRKWQRNERGIFDKTHRTVIVWRNLPEFLRDCPEGELRLLKRNFRFFETKRFWKVNMLITYALFPLLLIPMSTTS